MKHSIEDLRKIGPNLEYRVGIVALPILVLMGIVAAIAFGELALTFIVSICFVPPCLGLLIAGTLPNITISKSGIIQKGLFGERVYKWQDAEFMYSNLLGGIQLRFSRSTKNNKSVQQPVDFPLSAYIENWANSHILDSIVEFAPHVEFPVEEFRSLKTWPFWVWPVTLFVILLFTFFLSLPLTVYVKEANFPQSANITVIGYFVSHISAGGMLLFYMKWLRFQDNLVIVIKHAFAIIISPFFVLTVVGAFLLWFEQAISQFSFEFVNFAGGVIALLVGGYVPPLFRNLFVFGRISQNVASYFDENL